MSFDHDSSELPPLDIETVDLYRDTAIDYRERYNELEDSSIDRPTLGTHIWWGRTKQGQSRCLKEFSTADPNSFGRKIPDPSLAQHTNFERQGAPTGRQRGLAPARAEIFDHLVQGTLQQEFLMRGPNQHLPFRSQFNVYSFELEALLMQFAKHYGCHRLVQSFRWGALRLPHRHHYRYTIEMERLEELALPTPKDYLQIMARLLDMMQAVTQLHSMLVPSRCFPPELTRDVNWVQQNPFVRNFHYDLSPDQFLGRASGALLPPQVVLIDFNASRMAQTEYSNFSWSTIPGKDYYQPPERRAHQQTQGGAFDFRSNPIYDLYALIVIGLFYLEREHESQRHIKMLPGWGSIREFYRDIHNPDFTATLRATFPTNRGITPEPLLQLMDALFVPRPEQRIEALQSLSPLRWNGDWSLLPRCTDFLARGAVGRELHICWQQPTFSIVQGQSPVPLTQLLRLQDCEWRYGSWEHDRLSLPDFDPTQLMYFQMETCAPVVYQGHIHATTPGVYTIYAGFGGCVDFTHPLHITVQAASHTHDELSADADDPSNFAWQGSAPSTSGDFQGHTGNELDTWVVPHRHAMLQGSAATQVIEETPEAARIAATIDDTVLDQTLPQTPAAPLSSLPKVELAAIPSALAEIREQNLQRPKTEATPSPEMPALAPTLVDQESVAPPTALWLKESLYSDDPERLDFLEEQAQSKLLLPIDAALLLVNVRTRRSELEYNTHGLNPDALALRQLAATRRDIEDKAMALGLLLNNLAICASLHLIQHTDFEGWETRFGYDPCEALGQWLRDTDPETHDPNDPRFYKIRERARETYEYSRKLARRWQSKAESATAVRKGFRR